MNLNDHRYYSDAHRQFGDTIGRFVRDEILPRVEAWEEYGGTPADVFYHLVALEELCRAAAGLVSAVQAPPSAAAGQAAEQLTSLPRSRIISPASRLSEAHAYTPATQ